MAKQIPPNQMELIPGVTEAVPKAKKPRAAKLVEAGHLPPNLGKPVKVTVPDFSDPKRPKTCLEVDFPLLPINALSALEGNAGKPIYQMSKWWARRRSCVFRAMLIAAAMEAPIRRGADGKPLLDENGVPVPDETEAAKAVWDVYYANHQKAENFKHLRVLDCFMGGGTTLVEGSRLGFQVAGVDLNPVAWFIVKNELACTDADEVKWFFDQIEAEVKPQIQPFYVTDCPRGHKGKWFDVETGAEVDVDPTTLPPDERKRYRYEGPEVVYTFWAKHGPCIRPECNHRTPIFRSPVIAEKKLGVKYLELTCKSCKTAFHAELGSARMAPAAERVVLDNEFPFTQLSQPFAKRLLEYSKGNREEKSLRVGELWKMVDGEPGLKCPKCGQFAGQWVRDVLKIHRSATRTSNIDKKQLKIQPGANGTKPVYAYLLIHPDWLKGSPGKIDGTELGGYIDAPASTTKAWYEQREQGLKLFEIRGQIKLSEDTSYQLVQRTTQVPTTPEQPVPADNEEPDSTEKDRKQYGLPHFVRLPDGKVLDTHRGTVTKKAAFACSHCGQPTGIINALRAAGQSASLVPYAIQGYCPTCDAESHVYNGRFFAPSGPADLARHLAAIQEWESRKDTDLTEFWPRTEIPYGWQTHFWSVPDHGYTHWYKMFNPRQLLCHALLLRSIVARSADRDVQEQVLGGFQQYLRNQCMFAFWDISRDCMAPFFSNANYVPKQSAIENCVFSELGRGNWRSTMEKTVESLAWAVQPWEPLLTNPGQVGSDKVCTEDPVRPTTQEIDCCSASDIQSLTDRSVDLAITDPPFGDNFIYSELANFFYAWLRLPLSNWYPAIFKSSNSPYAQEAVTNVAHHPDDASGFYESMLTACWAEAHRVLKDGGILAFTFHHSEDSQWAAVLASLFDSRFYLEATFPITSDESKGEAASFGSKRIEYDIIHVCRKRLEDPTPVSWAKMRQWVKAELKRLRRLLEAYKASDLSAADIRVILRGKALEFYSRHYGKVFTAEDAPMSIRDALLGINQLLDEDTGEPGERPPSILQPVAHQFLRLFGTHTALSRDDVGKTLRGTGLVQRELEERGWVIEKNKVVTRVPIKERFESARSRPRREMKTEIDQAHFLIGAALPGSGVNIEEELGRNTWAVRRSVEAVLQWYARTAPEPDIKQAADLAAKLLRDSLDKRRTQLVQEQGYLFDDLDEVV